MLLVILIINIIGLLMIFGALREIADRITNLEITTDDIKSQTDKLYGGDSDISEYDV